MPSPLLDRRRAVGLLAGGAVAALASSSADALRGWCRVDPILRIAGQDLHLWVALWAGSMAEARRLADGPVLVACALPPGVTYDRLDRNPGFGEGFVVTWQEALDLDAGGPVLPLRARVRIPTAGSRGVPAMAWLEALTPGPVAAGIAAARAKGSARGRSNAWLALATP